MVSMALRERLLIAGRYRVERQIGSGGMGAVWLATDQTTGNPVALKSAHSERSDHQVSREADIVRDIRHPRIVALLDVVTEGGASWLVLEYVPSRDLAGIIDADGVLPPADVARIGYQVADALEALHSKGIIHGDVSPGNVLITKSGDAKLTDFGVSRAIWSDATVTAGGLVPGTPAYLAPEVARGGDRTPASDIFSLGATLFAAVEGVSPLGKGENPLTVVWRAASGHISAPTAGPLGEALAKMLQRNPADRPDAIAAKELLTNIDNQTPPGHRKRNLIIAAAAVVAIIVAASMVFITRPDHSATPTKAVATVGDPHTADLCALVKPSTVSRFGTATLSTDYGNFDRCDVLITKNGDDLADVTVTLENGSPPAARKQDHTERRGAVTVVSQPAADGECDRFLSLRGGHFAVASAKLTGSRSMNICGAATAAANYAATVFNRGPIPRRTNPWPHASLANADACDLLNQKAFAQTPDVGRPSPTPTFGNWECDWGDSVELIFDRNSPLTADDGQPVRINGRQAFITPNDDGPGTCVAQVVYRPYQDPNGEDQEEIVELEIAGNRPVTKLCADARTLAATAITRLPKA